MVLRSYPEQHNNMQSNSGDGKDKRKISGGHSWVSELGHPEVKQVPCPKESTSENLQAEFKHNEVSNGTVG